MTKIVGDIGDEDTREQLKLFKSAVSIRDVDTSYVRTKTTEVTNYCEDAKNRLSIITNSGEHEDIYMSKMKNVMSQINDQLSSLQKQAEEISTRHKFMCAFFSVPLSDEMVEKSEEFFKTF